MDFDPRPSNVPYHDHPATHRRRERGKRSSMDAAAKTALFNALAWIESRKSDAGVDSENVEVGLQCLT
jgi:hypothetical protein